MKFHTFSLVVVSLILGACADGESLSYDSGTRSDTAASATRLAAPETESEVGDDAAAVAQATLSPDEMLAEPGPGAEAPVIDAPVTERSEPADADGYTEMDWDELLPPGFSFDPWLDEIDLASYDMSDLDDSDEEAQRLYVELQELLADVPSYEGLQGVMGRLPGFAVPIEFDGSKVYSFLLVPYYGACIHTPPPPANQMVYVEYPEGFDLPSLYEPIVIEGAFEVATHVEDGLGTAGYSMQASKVTLY